MLIETVTKILLGFLQLVIGLALAMAAIYIGIRLFSRLTKGAIELEKELANGNRAIATFTLGLVVAIAIVISGGVVGLTTAITTLPEGGNILQYMQAIGAGFIQLIFGIICAALAIFIGFRVWDKITKEIDEVEELKNDNIAVGIVMAGVMIAVAIIIQSGISGLSSALGI